MSGTLWTNGRIVVENVSIELTPAPVSTDLQSIGGTVGPEGLPGKYTVVTVLNAEDAGRLLGAGSQLASLARQFYAEVKEAERRRETQTANRRAWEARILARLATPTEDDRTEAAALSAWMRATPGYKLPLP